MRRGADKICMAVLKQTYIKWFVSSELRRFLAIKNRGKTDRSRYTHNEINSSSIAIYKNPNALVPSVAILVSRGLFQGDLWRAMLNISWAVQERLENWRGTWSVLSFVLVHASFPFRSPAQAESLEQATMYP